jgi:nucleotide-binding universal stress UspA family protein
MWDKEGQMNTEERDSMNYPESTHILIAVDGSDNARRAVTYVGDFLQGLPWVHVTLLTIVSEPPEDYFTGPDERLEWVSSHTDTAEKMLKEYRDILTGAGFRETAVDDKLIVKNCASIAECILEEQKKLRSSTIVIGRRGISKKEEFIFGSTSNKILHSAKNCSLWVIE